MKKVAIDEFLALAGKYPVLDVRSPAEYKHAHIPGAYSLPLFSDEERKVVGTAYKQEGRKQAIKIGLEYFGVKMRTMIEEVERILKSTPIAIETKDQFPINDCDLPTATCVMVHCWRGGMRSAGVAWLLDIYGFNVYVLDGGYKSFRNWVLQRFEQPYSFRILGGYTGSGKTEVLKQLEKEKQSVIDLEGIAHHKGSAFGALGQELQPTQEMFENILGLKLNSMGNGTIWIEDESQRVGAVNLPGALWNTMRRSPVDFMDIPFEERLNYITQEYGKFDRKELINCIIRLQKRLGGQNTKDAINHMLDGDINEGFRILLHYYDKYYAKGMQDRKELLSMIACAHVDAQENSKKLTTTKTIA